MLDWMKEPPPEWERRLREVSPVTDALSHLRFRWRDPQPHFLNPDEGQWELYACTPKPMVHPSRAEQFAVHWADLPKAKQAGRKAFVTTYQFHMWHHQGVDAKRFWVLQGEWGGTPAAYTQREKRVLDASNAISEEFPIGFFPACPFDERVVQAVLRRDRMLKYGNNLDELVKQNRPDRLKAEDDLAEKEFREKFLDEWYATIQPQAEFMKSYLRKSESEDTMRKATRQEADAVSQWKDHFVETGIVIGAGGVGNRAVQVAVG